MWSSKESEKLQIPSGLQDSQEYSSRCQLCASFCDLDFSSDFHSSSHFPNPLGSFRVNRLQIVLLLPPCSTVFSVLWEDPSICQSFRFLLFSFCGSLEEQNQLDSKFFFSCQHNALVSFLVCLMVYRGLCYAKAIVVEGQ